MVSEEKSIYSIKCTNCAAPLVIRGGGRVTTVTCEYCNSVLDIANEYKVLSQFHDKYRPSVPFKLGMQGYVNGVEWTIIGWVSYMTTDFPVERWSEFFLYSPLYGYGWLIYEEGKVSFSKRVRDFPLREWQDANQPKSQSFRKSRYTLAEESYTVEIDFVQGELSWIAKAEDKIRCWDYDGPSRKSISIEKSQEELEVYLNQKLDSKKIYDSFGVKKEKQKKEKQSAIDKVFDEGDLDETEKSMQLFTKLILVLLLMITLMLGYSLVSGKVLLEEHTNQSFVRSMTVDSDAFLSKIEIKAPTPNLLNLVNLEIYDSSKRRIFIINKDRLYAKSGYVGETWLVGDDEATVYLKLKEGLYRVSLKMTKPTTGKDKITVRIEEKVVRLTYILTMFILLIIVFAFTNKGNSLLDGRQMYFWRIVVPIIGYFMFGFGIVLVLVALYLFAGYINKADSKDSEGDDSSDWWEDDDE